MTEGVDALFANAAAKRGFWAGLFPVPGSIPESLIPDRVDTPPIDDMHVTLAHFGRGTPAQTVERVITACQRAVDPPIGVITAKSWGRARLDQSRGSVAVLLLEGHELEALQAALIQHCSEVGVNVDDRFAFHPHVTLGRYGLQETVELESFRTIGLHFAALSLVCGDARVDFSLGKSPF